MEAFGNFIFWMVKIFLLLTGFALILGGGFCVVMPLLEKADGFGVVFTAVGLVSMLIGGIAFWAALRIIRSTSAAQDMQRPANVTQTVDATEADKTNGAEEK